MKLQRLQRDCHPRRAAHVDTGSSVALTPTRNSSCTRKPGARKIQLNMTFDMVREAAKQPHTDPLVTVAIRSDGSVESVTFVQSSGVAAIDEAIRRIVDSQRPYQVFPPGLASECDVIEIRRTWHFDTAIRLY